VASPTIAPSGDRLAYATIQFNRAIFRFDPEGPGRVLLASSLSDGMSQFSPDGRRLVFESLRSGETSEIWLAASDGSNPTQLTHGPGRWQGSPYWSPDGGRIAFDSQGLDGRWDIWTIGVDGASPERLTQDAGDEGRPSFSRDGRWVYFGSARSGVPELWRVPATGGVEEQVTHGGAEGLALESPDGRELLYKRSAGSSALLSLPLAGGAERTLVKCVSGEMGFGIAAGLVYHWGCEEPALHLFDPKSGRDRILGKLKGPSDMLTVSPDGATVLYTHVVNPGSDLKLIENFR
jgi:Tol biopolymer transport system component